MALGQMPPANFLQNLVASSGTTLGSSLSAMLAQNPGMLGQVGQMLGGALFPDPITGALMINNSSGVPIPLDAISQLAQAPSTLPGAIPSSFPGGLPGIPSQLGSALSHVGGGISKAVSGLFGSGGAGPAAAAGRDVGLAGPGLLGTPGVGSAAGLVSGLATGAVGFGLGSLIGPKIGSNQAQSGLGGAASGAAAGFLATGGNPIGAVIGAIAGGLGGVFGKSKAVHAQKEASIEAEIQATQAARPEALRIGQDLYRESLAIQPKFDQLKPTISGPLSQLLMARDPETLQMFSELQQLFTIRDDTGKAISPERVINEGLSPIFLRVIEDALARGTGYAPGVEANAESSAGLLTSGEVGRFFPGRDMLLRSAHQQAKGIEILDRLLQRIARG